jgi:putative CocE/NonD family hydrolase
MRIHALAVAPFLVFGLLAQSAPFPSLRDRFEKHEHRIPMRDGVHLFTAVYVPKDRSKPHPILMNRTPYSVRPYGEDQFPEYLGPGAAFADVDYIFVRQDVRGCYMSEGEFVDMRPHRARKTGKNEVDESTDAYDTIEWLLANVPGHNGKVGMWGISYPGFYAAASMIDAHPALVAVSPQAPIADWWYDDFHHHGALFLPHAFNFLGAFGKPRPQPTTDRGGGVNHGTPDGYRFFLELGSLANVNERWYRGEIAFWNDIVAHPNYDSFWQERNLLPHLRHTAPAVLTVGGWFDAEDLYGALQIYRAVEAQNPGIANTLVMGPWGHGGWARSDGDRLGYVRFGAKTGELYRNEIERPFFARWLEGEETPALPEGYVFETGSNRWRTFDAWPPREAAARELFFREDGGLAFAPPSGDAAHDEFVSDPARPVPFTEAIAIGMTREYMTDDQRFASRRPDVLVYCTEPLQEPITLAGPLTANLWVSTSQQDADWVVKLIDVYPDDTPTPADFPPTMKLGGYQQMVRSEVVRGRFRGEDDSKPEPFVPGQPARVAVPLLDVLHTFQPGHRIMVHVQSTWFPLVDRNPQRWVDNIYLAKETDFTAATHRVYRGGKHLSRLVIGVLPAETTGR